LFLKELAIAGGLFDFGATKPIDAPIGVKMSGHS
jgi:hypothetical protein